MTEQHAPTSVELLTIGSELLLGSTIDTNGAFLGERLAAAGFRVTRRTTIGDVHADITSALTAALARAPIVICTGGLGPTPDDFTKDVVAAIYGVPLELHEEWLHHVEQRFRERGIDMPPINRNQAMLPAGAEVFPNPRGTAPGVALHRDDLGTTILLPGVPGEMRALCDAYVLPWLHARFGRPAPIVSRMLRTTGIAESALAERLAAVEPQLEQLGLSLAYLPAGIGTDLRLTSWGDVDEVRAEWALAEGARRLREAVPEFVYGEGREDLAALVGERLRARGWTLAVAESCTGGLISSRITAVAGSSEYFLGGLVAYSNHVKVIGGVERELIETHGAVSEQVARALAEAGAEATSAECAIGVTGIAGPGGGTEEKPVGTVWIAVHTPAGTDARLHRFGGTRGEIQARAAQAALHLLFRALL